LEKEKPDLMVVEEVFSLQRYPASGISLAKVTGVVLLAGSNSKIPVCEIPVREAKQVLTGNGNASKKQLERTVRGILDRREPISPDHASDALGLALIGLYRFDAIRIDSTVAPRDL
jgi:crossover junction endodeoxyribonuclease RuvC